MTEDERYEKLNDKLDKILDKLNSKLEDMSKSIQNHEVKKSLDAPGLKLHIRGKR